MKHKLKNIRVQEFKQAIIQQPMGGKYYPLLRFEFTAGVQHRATFLKAMNKGQDVRLVAYPNGKPVSTVIPFSTVRISITKREEEKNTFTYTCTANKRTLLVVEGAEAHEAD